MSTGQRFQNVELSTIDTSLLLAGILLCQSYYDAPTRSKPRSARWPTPSISAWTGTGRRRGARRQHGLAPGRRVHPHRLDRLQRGDDPVCPRLGSPTMARFHRLEQWVSGYQWGTFRGQSYVQFGPLFGPRVLTRLIDFRGVQDAYMRGQGIDYFENSRRATYAHRAYAIANPMAWTGYSSQIWGLTASTARPTRPWCSTGARASSHLLGTRVSQFESNDDGTIAPTAAGGAVAFAPEIAIPALLAMRETYGSHLFSAYGFRDAFNPTFTTTSVPWSAAPWTPRSAGSTSTTWASIRADHCDDRELPDGTDLAADARQHAYRPGTVPGGFSGGGSRASVRRENARGHESRVNSATPLQRQRRVAASAAALNGPISETTVPWR